MTKKLVTGLLAVSMGVSLVIGSSAMVSASEGAEKSITFNIGQEPTTLDPGLNSGVSDTMVITHLYDGLLKEKDHEMIPATADSYEVSDDGLVYTFHIREDALWSDGKPVTANDFEFAWKRVQDPVVASSYSWIFDSGNIVSYRAVDERTFEVTLSSPTPVFLSLLGNTTFFPLREDMIDYENGGWALDPAKVVCNGAYYMETYAAGDRVVLKKNENYYNAEEVKIDELIGLMIADQTTALTGYESGQIDAIFAVPPAEVPRLLMEDPNFMTFEGNTTNYYCFNTEVEPFDDIRVRQAFSYAIDRTAMCNDVLKGADVPACCLVPGAIYDSEGNVFNEKAGDYGIPTDLSKLDEAKQLLADAGYPDGEGFPEFEILYNTGETNKAICEALQQMWADNLGVKCTLVNMESSVFHQTRVQHDFTVCRGGWTGDYADPLTHLEIYVSDSPMNYGSWKNEEYDALINEARELSGKERFDKFYEASKILVESYVYMPISYKADVALVNNDKIVDWYWMGTSAPTFVYADVIE